MEIWKNGKRDAVKSKGILIKVGHLPFSKKNLILENNLKDGLLFEKQLA